VLLPLLNEPPLRLWLLPLLYELLLLCDGRLSEADGRCIVMPLLLEFLRS
jgi:hypothetical protein